MGNGTASNNITMQKVWTAILIVATIGGGFVTFHFLKNIQPYVNAQTQIKIDVEKLKTWKEGHECTAKEFKDSIKSQLDGCPTKKEIEPEFRSLNDKLDALQKKVDETNGNISDIHKWIMRQSRPQ